VGEGGPRGAMIRGQKVILRPYEEGFSDEELYEALNVIKKGGLK